MSSAMIQADGGSQSDVKGNYGGQGAEVGETRYEGPCQRMCGAIGSLCAGVMLVFITCYAEFSNEQTFVHAEATANLVKTATPVGCTRNSAQSYPDDLVLVSCPVTQPDMSSFLPSLLSRYVSAFYGSSISWNMEIYQWQESSSQNCRKTNTGGQECQTIYNYNSAWSSTPISSDTFHSTNPEYQNSGSFPANLQNGRVGAPLADVALVLDNGNLWYLSQNLVDQFPLKMVNVEGPPQSENSYPGQGDLESTMLHADHGYISTGVPGAPRIGDIRISLIGTGLPQNGYGTVCAQQTFDQQNMAFGFRQYPGQPFDFWGRVTNPLSHFEAGHLTPKQFEENWHNENAGTAFIFRLFLWFLMCYSISMIFSPLSVMADGLRLINFVSCGLGSLLDSAAQSVIQCAAFLVGSVLFLIVFAVAWIVSNPTFGVGLLAVALVAYFIGLQFAHKTVKGRELSYVKIVDLP